MTSPFERISNLPIESSTNDMSPVTDLALNMKGLTTTLIGTPNRRISWSDPFPNHDGVTSGREYSPCTDSPMLQEILMRNMSKVKRIPSRKILLSDTGDKENVPPKIAKMSENSVSEDDSICINDSQDSGYSSTCGRHLSSVAYSSSPCIRVKSSTFMHMNNEEIDNGFFLLEEDIEMDTTSGLNVNSLLTKPLCNLDTPTDIPLKRGKLPARRCLTLEMDNSDSPPVKSSQSNSHDIEMEVQKDRSSDVSSHRRYPFKRPDSCNAFSIQSKRRKSSPSITLCDDDEEINFTKQRSFSETAATIMQAIQISDSKPDLIGDCSRCYALPIVKGRHQDLKCISVDTLAQLLTGEYSHAVDSYTLIDCRYPYEYEAGHILGAQNIYTKEDIMQKFLNVPKETSEKHIIIFHCEFSSERAPSLCRFLRNKDRELNECNYPKLNHPEIYLLDGGYKAFFANFKDYCEPQNYKPMNHKDHGSELRLFRAKSKSWGSDSKAWYKMKSSIKSDNV